MSKPDRIGKIPQRYVMVREDLSEGEPAPNPIFSRPGDWGKELFEDVTRTAWFNESTKPSAGGSTVESRKAVSFPVGQQ